MIPDVVDAVVEELRLWIIERMGRMRDALDREAFLVEANSLLDDFWDDRAAHDAKAS